MKLRLHSVSILVASTVAFTGMCLAPVWRMGYLRDDWLLLWSALDGSTAPAGASGVFPRPVAEGLWRVATFVGGDAPAAMHVVSLLGWTALLILLARELRAWGATSLATALAVGWVVSHGALVEPRLWSAASNGVWAAAFAIAALSLHRRGGVAHLPAVGLWILALLTRADGLALLGVFALWQLRDRRPSRSLRLLLVMAIAALATALLTWMLAAGGQWGFRLADSGRALRLLVVPWGPELAEPVRAGLGALVAASAALFVGRWLQRNSPVAGGLALLFALLLAHALVSWSVAGRYLLLPVLLSSALLALALPSKRSEWPVLWFSMLLAAAVAVGFGRSARDLQKRSSIETELYAAVRAHAAEPAYQTASRLRLLEAPAVGWRGEKADLENIVSAALQRLVSVEVQPGPGPALRWTGEQWVESGGAHELP